MENLESFMGELFTLDHWPWMAICVIFTIIGQFTSTRLFVRERAYTDYGSNLAGKMQHWFWYWGRESLPVHPILAGAMLAMVWVNPEGADPAWGVPATAAYFGSSGAISLGAWMWLKAKAKARGITLTLPGASMPPPQPSKPGEDGRA